MNEIDKLTNTELAYLAGILDGEGSIGMVRDLCPKGDRKVRFRVRLTVAVTTSLDLLSWIVLRLGGMVHTNNRGNVKHATAYRIVLKESDADIIIPLLLPHLVIKKRQAELFIRYRKLQRFCWEHRTARRNEIKSIRFLRDWFFEEFRILNRRGPSTVTTNTQDTVTFEQVMVKIESELQGDLQRVIGDNAPPTIQ